MVTLLSRTKSDCSAKKKVNIMTWISPLLIKTTSQPCSEFSKKRIDVLMTANANRYCWKFHKMFSFKEESFRQSVFLRLHPNAQTKALLELLESTTNKFGTRRSSMAMEMVLCLNVQILQLCTSNEATRSSSLHQCGPTAYSKEFS